MNFNVEDYLGELDTLAFNNHYNMIIDENNDLKFLRRDGDFDAAVVTAKFVLDYEGDNFWYEPKMEIPTNVLYGMYYFTRIVETWKEAAEICDFMAEHSWYIEEDE